MLLKATSPNIYSFVWSESAPCITALAVVVNDTLLPDQTNPCIAILGDEQLVHTGGVKDSIYRGCLRNLLTNISNIELVMDDCVSLSLVSKLTRFISTLPSVLMN